MRSMTNTVLDAAKRVGLSLPRDKEIRGVEADTRKILPGQLFFALKGQKVDGHAYLKDAAAKGASAAVVSQDYKGESFGLPLIGVPDVLLTLHNLAKEAVLQKGWRVVAITGSVGKTTTKEFLATLLEAKFRVVKTPGNANSQTGLPTSILNMEKEGDLFVMEAGMTAPKEIEKLIEIAPPEVALITRIGLAHAAYFEDGLEGIARAKAAIFSHPDTKMGFLNVQCRAFDAAMNTGRCEKRTFGFEKLTQESADYLLKENPPSYLMQEKSGISPSFSLPFAATHLCENFAGAAAVARYLGMSWEEIAQQATKLTPYKLRFERVEREGVVFINDCYNANPISMRAAFANLPKPKAGGRTIGVLGTMVELGAHSEASHRAIGEEALNIFDHLFCFGKESLPIVETFSRSKKPAEFFLDIDLLRARLFSHLKAGDVVLIKGSNSMALWRVLEVPAS